MRTPGHLTILRASEDGAGAGGTTPPAAAPTGGGQPPGGDGQGTPPPVVPYRPEGLPDDLYGASERETIDRLFAGHKGLREKLGRFGELGALPKDAEGYAFDMSDKLKPYLPNLEADPVWKAVREGALKAGLRDKQFGPFMTHVLDAMIDGDFVQPPVDLAAEKAKLLPAEAASLDEAGKNAAIDRRVRDNHAMIEAWKSRGLPAESAQGLALMLDTAAANQAVEWLAAQMKTAQPALGGETGKGFTEADLKARQRDPRGRIGDSAYDPAFAAETNRLYQSLFPA